MTSKRVHVGVEFGGTKIVVGVSRGGAGLTSRTSLLTRDPDATFADLRTAIETLVDDQRLVGIGVAAFGPIDLRRESPTYGTMLATPKKDWSGIEVLGRIRRTWTVPIALDTDVNAAALGEHAWGSGTADSFVYLTVGTGVGGGIWSDGHVLRGANHSEIGHVRIPRHPQDSFEGSCPFHGDCLEGMASGTAMRQRWAVPAKELGPHFDDALEFESWYLAHGIAALCAVIPVQQVIIGGGVGKMEGLHAAVADRLGTASGRYPAVPFAEGGPQILGPGLGDNAGVVGAIELARQLTANSEHPTLGEYR